LLEGCWTVAGRLEIQPPLKDPKSTKRERRHKYVKPVEATGLEVYR